jgi:hypothetical protein
VSTAGLIGLSLSNSSEDGGLGDASKGNDKRRRAPGKVSMFLQFSHRGIAAGHDLLESFVNLFLGLAEALDILSPFKITDRNATGVREDVGDHGNASFIEDFIGFTIGRRVGGFDDGLRLDIACNSGVSTPPSAAGTRMSAGIRRTCSFETCDT